MDHQKNSNVKIGVSGVGKNYLKMPWSVEDTIENLEELKEIMKQKMIDTNYQGRGEKDAEEVSFDFNRAINALKENQEYHKTGLTPKQVAENICELGAMKRVLGHYKQLGTLEEVREAVEKQKKKKPRASNRCYVCPRCGLVTSIKIKHNYCDACGQHINWREEESPEPYHPDKCHG